MNTSAILMNYLVAMNIIGFFIMMMDKRRARKKKYRIRERTLWIIACCGGVWGVFCGMYVFRHKTKHRSFVIGVPLLGMIEVAIFLYIYLS
ncbi:DUF1294 domain-containing protein [Ornithinibacillus gellani]|uniref:DUF1294 domain-containing protein n=1 Tax=Ornithinibacillus gellani TaxID=2293253 RepID=UPI000F47D88F|nr:DUF1294 domain-containing protein [Ornithinibacillus gellani]TQS76227.1 DUF1294 domain-containing protein [Ornithinibacillus gellani]